MPTAMTAADAEVSHTSIMKVLGEPSQWSQPYRDRGADYYDKRRPGTAIKTALQRLRDAGCHITTNQEGILITTA